MKEINFYLHKATVADRQVLYRLLQYLLFEESATDGNKISDDGSFEYKWFDAYFSDADREAYIFKDSQTNNILGFAMVCEHVRTCKKGHSIAEFMVLPPYRRNKIGKRAAVQIFNTHKGMWEVKPSFGSERAYKFWENTIGNFAKGKYKFQENVFVFEN